MTGRRRALRPADIVVDETVPDPVDRLFSSPIMREAFTLVDDGTLETTIECKRCLQRHGYFDREFVVELIDNGCNCGNPHTPERIQIDENAGVVAMDGDRLAAFGWPGGYDLVYTVGWDPTLNRFRQNEVETLCAECANQCDGERVVIGVTCCEDGPVGCDGCGKEVGADDDQGDDNGGGGDRDPGADDRAA